MLVHATAILATRADNRPERQQARSLKLRSEIGGHRSVVHHVPEKVVTARAVPTATADQSMVAEAVQNAITGRTLQVSTPKRDA